VDAFADQGLPFEAFHLEDEAAAIHFGEFGVAADSDAHGTGFQVLDVDGDADGGVAFTDFVADGHEAGLFHEGDHCGGGEDFQRAGTIDGGGVFVLHHKLFAVTETGQVGVFHIVIF